MDFLTRVRAFGIVMSVLLRHDRAEKDFCVAIIPLEVLCRFEKSEPQGEGFVNTYFNDLMPNSRKYLTNIRQTPP